MRPLAWLATHWGVSEYMLQWLYAYVLTQLCEIPIYWQALRERPKHERFWLAFGASAITHPFVSFFFPEVADVLTRGHPYAYFYVYVLIAEAFAYGVEAVYLHALGVKRGWLWSIAANSTSLGLGFVSTWLLHMP